MLSCDIGVSSMCSHLIFVGGVREAGFDTGFFARGGGGKPYC